MPNRVQWETPGGKIEANESQEDAAKREVLEEINLSVSIIKRIGMESFREDKHEMDYVWFLAKIENGEPKILETNKYDQLAYWSFDELAEMNDLSPNTKNLVDTYFAGKLDL